MAAKRTSSARNPYQGDAFELAKYRKAREKWERDGRRGPPPAPPKRRNPKPSEDLFEEIDFEENTMKKRARGKKNPHGHKHHVGCGCPLDAQRKMAAGHGACCDSCARAAARPQNPGERKLAKRVVSC